MDILSLIDELENLLQRSRRIPGGKLLVDESAVQQIIEQMRESAPDEVRLGQRIASEREHILADARAQAHRMIEEAQMQVASRMDDQGVVQAARERARGIIADAEQRAAALQAQTNQYVANQLNALESRLLRLLREVQAGQRFMTQPGADGDTPAKTGNQS